MSRVGFKANIDLIRENFSIIIVQVTSSLTQRTIFLCSPLKKSASYHFLAAPIQIFESRLQRDVQGRSFMPLWLKKGDLP